MGDGLERLLRRVLGGHTLQGWLLAYATCRPVGVLKRAMDSRYAVAFVLLLFVVEAFLIPADILDDRSLNGSSNQSVEAFLRDKLEQPIRDLQPDKAYDAFLDRTAPKFPATTLPPFPTFFVPSIIATLNTGLPTPPLCPTTTIDGRCETPDSRRLREALTVARPAAAATPAAILTPLPTPAIVKEDNQPSLPGWLPDSAEGTILAFWYFVDQGPAGWVVMSVAAGATAALLLALSRLVGPSVLTYVRHAFVVGLIGSPVIFVILLVATTLGAQFGLALVLAVVRNALHVLGVVKVLEFAVSAPLKAADLVHDWYGVEVAAAAESRI